MEKQLVIVAAGRRVDGIGDLTAVREAKAKLAVTDARIREYKIAPLAHGWNNPLPAGYLKSACAPIEAVIAGRRLIHSGELDAVLISGKDFSRSDFVNRHDDRNRLTQVYGNRTFLSAYDDVTRSFLNEFGMKKTRFYELRERLFENHWSTWHKKNPQTTLPAQKWFEPVSEYFRGVDCANPNVDFEGELVITTLEYALSSGFAQEEFIAVQGVALEEVGSDGLAYIDQIVKYRHLRQAFKQAGHEAQIDFINLFRDHQALLEVYTCFPIVPLAFLLATGLVKCEQDLDEFLTDYSVTITGGLNLAKAPWNNTTLSAVIEAVILIRSREASVIGLHSNGALGYRQGFMILTDFSVKDQD